MLGSLFNIVEKTKNLNEKKIFIKIILMDDVRLLILDLNKQKQLFEKGITDTGEIIGYYSEWTEFISKGKKQAGTPYTLYDTGDFYRSFDVAVYSEGEFKIEANTIKDDGTDLQKKYQKEGDILGLTLESKNTLRDYIYPKIIEEILKQLYENN